MLKCCVSGRIQYFVLKVKVYAFCYFPIVMKVHRNFPSKNQVFSLRGIRSDYLVATKPAITCSKLTIETLEQGVKYVQS